MRNKMTGLKFKASAKDDKVSTHYRYELGKFFLICNFVNSELQLTSILLITITKTR